MATYPADVVGTIIQFLPKESEYDVLLSHSTLPSIHLRYGEIQFGMKNYTAANLELILFNVKKDFHGYIREVISVGGCGHLISGFEHKLSEYDKKMIFIFACTKGDLSSVKILIEKYKIDPDCLIEEPYFSNKIPLVAAVKSENIELVKYLLADSRTCPSVNDNEPLFIAVSKGNLEIVKILFTDKRIGNYIEGSIIEWAVEFDHLNILIFILKQYDRFISKNYYYAIQCFEEAIHEAVKRGNEKTLKMLLSHEGTKDIKLKSLPRNWTYASRLHPNIVKIILEDGRIKLETDDLLTAVGFKKLEMIDRKFVNKMLFGILLSCGKINIDLSLFLILGKYITGHYVNELIDCILISINLFHDANVIETLFKHGLLNNDHLRKSLYLVLKYGINDLYDLIASPALIKTLKRKLLGQIFTRSVASNKLKSIELLLKTGFIPTPINDQDIMKIDVKTIEILVGNKLIDQPLNEKILLESCLRGYVNLVKMLLADSNIDVKETHVFTAIQGGNIDIIKLLLADKRVIVGIGSLRLAIKTKNIEITELLLNSNKINEIEAKVLRIVRQIFAKNIPGTGDIIELFLKHNLVKPSLDNNIIIQWASLNGYVRIVKMLLADKEVDPSVNNNYPIRKAAEKGWSQVVSVLLKDRRVDPTVEDNWALKYATLYRHTETIHILSEYTKQ